MRVAGWVAAVSLVMAMLGLASWAEVGRTTLGGLSASSEVVVIGMVERVVELPVNVPLFAAGDKPTRTLHLARVAVDEWLQGAPRSSHVWYLADPTWICDVSAAVTGERALFFLRPAFALAREPSGPPLAAIGKATEGAPLYEITASGNGRMPLREVAGATYADVWLSPVRLPADVEVLPPHVMAFQAIRGWARLDDLRRRLRDRAPRRESPSVAPADALPALLRRLEAREVPGDPYAFLAAINELSRRRNEFLPLLEKLLLDPDAPHREAAALVLGVEGVAPWLGSENALERCAAAWALQFLATQEGTDLTPVAKRLAVQVGGDPDAEVRWRLLRALVPPGRNEPSGVDGTVARARVVAALSDSSPVVALQAAEAAAAMDPWRWNDPDAAADRKRALALLGTLAASTDLRTLRAAWAGIAALHGDAAEAFLAGRTDGIDGLDVVARRFLVASLGSVPAASAAARLERLLAHADPWVRSAAVHGLALRQDARAVEVMARALLDADASVAESALREIDLLEKTALRQAALPGVETALARTTDASRRANLTRVLAELRR